MIILLYIVVKRIFYLCLVNLEKINVIFYIRFVYSFIFLFLGVIVIINSDLKKKLVLLVVESVNICFIKC